MTASKKYAMLAAGFAALAGTSSMYSGIDRAISRGLMEGSQCTGKGNETKPVGHVKKKKKAFGAPKLSKKQRKKNK